MEAEFYVNKTAQIWERSLIIPHADICVQYKIQKVSVFLHTIVKILSRNYVGAGFQPALAVSFKDNILRAG